MMPVYSYSRSNVNLTPGQEIFTIFSINAFIRLLSVRVSGLGQSSGATEIVVARTTGDLGEIFLEWVTKAHSLEPEVGDFTDAGVLYSDPLTPPAVVRPILRLVANSDGGAAEWTRDYAAEGDIIMHDAPSTNNTDQISFLCGSGSGPVTLEVRFQTGAYN